MFDASILPLLESKFSVGLAEFLMLLSKMVQYVDLSSDSNRMFVSTSSAGPKCCFGLGFQFSFFLLTVSYEELFPTF